MNSAKRQRHRFDELIARWFGRQGESSMTRRPQVRWSDDGLIGSPRNIQEKLAAYQARGLGRSRTGRSATQPEPASSSMEVADAEPTIPATMPSLGSSRSLWADKWQR